MITQDRRKCPRKKVTSPIPIIDRDSEQLLGHLVNLCPDGFMLLSPSPLDINRVFQVRMELPEAFAGEWMPLGVESLWREVSSAHGRYWVGFQIIDISPTDRRRIQELIEQYL